MPPKNILKTEISEKRQGPALRWTYIDITSLSSFDIVELLSPYSHTTRSRQWFVISV